MWKRYCQCVVHTSKGPDSFRLATSTFVKNLTLLGFISFCESAKAIDILCPPMPVAVTERNRDVKSEIAASVIALGKVKGGDVGIKTEITAANLFAKYPNVDKLLALQTMSSTYCGLLKHSTISDKEKLDRWEKFTSRILELQVPGAATATSVSQNSPKAGKDPQIKGNSLRPRSYSEPFRFDEKRVSSAENAKVVGQSTTVRPEGDRPRSAKSREAFSESETSKHPPPSAPTQANVIENVEQQASNLSMDQYAELAFSGAESKRRPLKKLLALDNMQISAFIKLFGSSRWEGGTHWGRISFDASGRKATYSNGPGRSPGTILLQGSPRGTVPLLLGEWWQDDGQSGMLLVQYESAEPANSIHVSWGPGRSVSSEWKRTSTPTTEVIIVD